MLGQAVRTRELQRLLAIAGYYLEKIDGIDGPKTQTALMEFEENGFMRIEDIEDVFFPQAYSQGKDAFIRACKAQCRVMGIGTRAQMAYVIASVDHETGGTFAPVKEGFDLTEAERRTKFRRYFPYFGRGHIQLTWRYNYAYFGELLGVNLLNRPDKALDKQNSLFITVYGMAHGKFTGRKLSDYVINSDRGFESARRVINGNDRKEHIAKIANEYLTQMS